MDDGEGIRYEYDSDGNQIRIHYPDGGCERMFYDQEGRRIKHVQPSLMNTYCTGRNIWIFIYMLFVFME